MATKWWDLNRTVLDMLLSMQGDLAMEWVGVAMVNTQCASHEETALIFTPVHSVLYAGVLLALK